jgi:exonuclease VII small subunit
MSETSSESASDLLERIIEEALNPYLGRLEDVVKAFEDAADRLIEEQRRLDMMRSEMARAARKNEQAGPP